MNKKMNRFKQARLKSNVKQQDVSKELNVKQSSVSAWEVGTTLPNIYNLIKLCKLYSVSSDYLLGIEKYNTEEMSIVERYTYNKKALERLQKEQAEIEIMISQLNEIKENQ